MTITLVCAVAVVRSGRRQAAPPKQRVGTFQTCLTLLLVLATGTAGLLAAPPSPPTIRIAEARLLPLGTTVTVDGSVTVPSGAFRSSQIDEGFAIQDRTAGIWISTPDNLGLPLRRQVRVTGTLADSQGLLVLVPESVDDLKLHGHGPKVLATATATGAVNEWTEGTLVEVSGVVTQPVFEDLPYGYEILIDDGSGVVKVFVYASTGIDTGSIDAGQCLRVTGLSAQFDTTYEVDPRSPDDVVVD